MKHWHFSCRGAAALLTTLCIVALLAPLAVQAAPPAAPRLQGGD